LRPFPPFGIGRRVVFFELPVAFAESENTSCNDSARPSLSSFLFPSATDMFNWEKVFSACFDALLSFDFFDLDNSLNLL
jgi:hypothetical protein